jgi:hypothetical protein
MNKQEYDHLPSEEKEHFMECSECGEMFDRRSLDEVMFHQDHKQRPDIQYSGSEPGTLIRANSNDSSARMSTETRPSKTNTSNCRPFFFENSILFSR